MRTRINKLWIAFNGKKKRAKLKVKEKEKEKEKPKMLCSILYSRSNDINAVEVETYTSFPIVMSPSVVWRENATFDTLSPIH